MILTCPNCATRFGVPDKALQPSGRMVKCSRCAHVWQAAADGKPAPSPTPPPAPVPVPVPEPPPVPVPAAPAVPEPPARTTPEVVDVAATPGPAPAAPASPPDAGDGPRLVETVPVGGAPPSPAPMRAETPVAARPRAILSALLARLRQWAAPIGWGFFVALVGVLALAIYFHEMLAADYPSTRPFYRVTKLMPQMNHDGLKVQKLAVAPDLGQVDARNLPATVTVRGEVVNESWMPRTIRTLQGRMRDAQRRDIQRWDVVTPRTWLWPGQAIEFSSEVPLQGARPFEIVIDLGPLE